MKINHETKVNVALFFLVTGISIYIIEIIFALLSLIPAKTIDKVKPIGNNAATAAPHSKFQIMMDLRKKGINAYTNVFPNYVGTDGLDYNGIKVFPFGSISNKTTVFCNEGDDPVIYEADEYGFRNPRGQYATDSFDAALIGDSFAQGHCVKDGEDIAGQLRSNNRKILNLGIEAIGPLIELGILSEYAKPFKPKNIFWLYYEGNDLTNLAGEKMSPALMKYLDKSFSQDLVHNQDLVDNALITVVEKAIADKEKHLKEQNVSEVKRPQSVMPSYKTIMAQIVKLDNLRLKLGFHENCIVEIDPLFRDILSEAKSRVESWGGRLYFVYLPAYDRYRYKKDMCVKRKFNLQREKVTALVNDLNIKMVDMTGSFDSQSDPLSLFHGHYNARGYKLVARKIEEHLELE
jgi:hypothetical protein